MPPNQPSDDNLPDWIHRFTMLPRFEGLMDEPEEGTAGCDFRPYPAGGDIPENGRGLSPTTPGGKTP